jgi:CRISPR/Cas system CSM-associated protein Csm3 (group 7 of RAMP superfamily)
MITNKNNNLATCDIFLQSSKLAKRQHTFYIETSLLKEKKMANKQKKETKKVRSFRCTDEIYDQIKANKELEDLDNIDEFIIGRCTYKKKIIVDEETLLDALYDIEVTMNNARFITTLLKDMYEHSNKLEIYEEIKAQVLAAERPKRPK